MSTTGTRAHLGRILSNRLSSVIAQCTRVALIALMIVAPSATGALAQNFEPEYNPLYDDSRIATVRITIDPALLDSIFAPGNEESDFEHPASFEYDDGTSVESVASVGFRLRGNTSRYSAKKSFKVSFNTFVQGQKFLGVEKLNLNGEHNDPSIVRSKLAWDLFNDNGVAASRAAHVRLFINGEYFGVYANIEHVDEQFLKSRFGDDSGNLYKCLYPADLAYLGPTAAAYRPVDAGRRPYDLKLKDSDDEGYDDLAHFIDVLNNTSDALFAEEISKVFDVNGFLRALAVDVVTGSWDNYWFLKNNYYLYNNPRTGLFEYIPYDFDNSFGIWWDGIEPGADWGTRDVYNWGSQSESRPLVDRIMAQSSFVERYSFFVEQLLAELYTPTALHPRIDELHDQIAAAAEADLVRTLDYGFTIDDFHDSFVMPLGGHVTYGLKPFVETRYQSAVNQVDPGIIRPIILDAYFDPLVASSAEPIHFYATVLDDEAGVTAEVAFEFDGASSTVALYDDGSHGDETAGDSRFAGIMPPLEKNGDLSFRFVGTDARARQSFSAWRTVTIGFTGAPLFINELMASNDASAADEHGDNDDWVEIYNDGENPISLAGYFFTDNLSNPDKWAPPDTTIGPGEFVMLWLDDEDTDQGPLHLPFKLSAGGEQFGIFDADLKIVDAVTFGEQETDVAYGRTIDGAGRFDFLASPTPGATNNTGTGTDETRPLVGDEGWRVTAYPNPFDGPLTLSIASAKIDSPTIEVFDTLGRRVHTSAENRATRWSLVWDGTNGVGAPVAAGTYFVRVVSGSGMPVARTTVVRLK